MGHLKHKQTPSYRKASNYPPLTRTATPSALRAHWHLAPPLHPPQRPSLWQLQTTPSPARHAKRVAPALLNASHAQCLTLTRNSVRLPAIAYALERRSLLSSPRSFLHTQPSTPVGRTSTLRTQRADPKPSLRPRWSPPAISSIHPLVVRTHEKRDNVNVFPPESFWHRLSPP
jgi:hypothetical protein